MNTLILRTTARLLLTLLLLFSIFLLVRGHNSPGGGFTGGLVAAAAWTLYSIAYGIKASRDALQVEPLHLIGLGLITGIVSGLISLLLGESMLTGFWLSTQRNFLDSFKVGTPILFDIGVYLVVIGVVLTIIFALEEEQ